MLWHLVSLNFLSLQLAYAICYANRTPHFPMLIPAIRFLNGIRSELWQLKNFPFWHRDSEDKKENAHGEKMAWLWEWDKTLELESKKLRQVKISSSVALLNLGIDTKQDWNGRDREAELRDRKWQGKHDLQNISLQRL